MRGSHHRAWPLHAAGAISLAGWALLAGASRGTPGTQLPTLLGVHGLAWVAFTLALGHATRAPVMAVFGWGALFRCCGFLAQPILEDDYFRFLWDGREFARTGNPYGSIPASHFADTGMPARFVEILDQVNHPHVPTIYGPLCQLGFLLSYWLAPGQLWPWKLIVLGADFAVQGGIVRMARSGGGSDTTSSPLLTCAWCPLMVFEGSFNAHPEVLGVALALGAWSAGARGRDALSGALAGLAVSARLLAGLLVPFLLPGRGARAWLAFSAAIAVCYGPFWVRGSAADLPGLRAMAGEWEFNSSIYALMAFALGPAASRAVCFGLFLLIWAVMVWNSRRTTPGTEAPEPGLCARVRRMPGDLVFGAFFLFSPTVNPWYLLWMVPFVAMRPSATGFVALAAVTLSYITSGNLGTPVIGVDQHPAWVRPLEFGLILMGLIADRCFLLRSQEPRGEH